MSFPRRRRGRRQGWRIGMSSRQDGVGECVKTRSWRRRFARHRSNPRKPSNRHLCAIQDSMARRTVAQSTLQRTMTKLAPASVIAPDLVSRAVPPFDDGYRLVFERNPTPMWVFDLDTHRFLAVNAAAV